MTTRDELVGASAERYGPDSQADRGRILDGFAALTSDNRERAIRVRLVDQTVQPLPGAPDV